MIALPRSGPVWTVGRFVKRLYLAQLYQMHRWIAEAQAPRRQHGRSWRIALSHQALSRIQDGTMRYEYRGEPMLKNPFDVALYPLVVWKTKPRTVIEIGSYKGVSAGWFADLMAQAGEPGQVISIDIEPPARPERADVRFLKGDVRKLGDTLTPELQATLPRPWLVVEDSEHSLESTTAALDFFAPLMRSGEYLVIEDAAITDLGWAPWFGGGPGPAISQFLRAHPEFEVDADLCDRYGPNFTGNPNGYLRRR